MAGDATRPAEPTFKDVRIEPGADKIPPGLEEETTLRSQGAKVFKARGGGAHVAQVFSGPVHYRDERGRWQEIDPSIVSVKGGFRNGAHEFDAFFPARLSSGSAVEVDHGGGASLSFNVAGAHASDAVAGAASVTYGGVLPHTDLTYEMTYDGYKENLVLDSAAAPASFAYEISTEGLDLIELDDGRIEIRRGAGSVGFFPRFFAQEAPREDGSAGELTYDVTTSLYEVSSTSYELRVALDESWLRASNRRFPVVVDPSFVSSNCGTCPPGTGVPALKDMSYSTGQSTMGFENHGTLRLGRDDTCCTSQREARTFMTFDISQEIRKVGNLIYEARFDIYNTNHSITNPATFELKRITADWSEYMTTAPPPPVDESMIWAEYDPCANGWCPKRTWWRWDVRDIMQYWIDKGVGTNHGWRLTASPGGYVVDWREMVSKENTAWVNERPYMFVAINAMPSTREFRPDDSAWPYLDLAGDALQNGAVVNGRPVLKIKDLTDTNQDPIVVRYQVSRSSSSFYGADLAHDSGWVAETHQYTVPTTLSPGTYYWRVMASDTCGTAYVDKDDPAAAAAGLCDDLSHDWGRPRAGAIERPMSRVRWFSVDQAGTSGMKAHVTVDVGSASTPSSLTLDSVDGFSETGGDATFEPDTPAREVFTYSGVDRSTNRLLGLTRTSATEHGEGTVVQAGSASMSTSTWTADEEVQRPDIPVTGPVEVVPTPSPTWLSDHCVTDDPALAANAVQPLFLYSGYESAPVVTNFRRPIRDIVFVADRPFAEAHLHFQQHMRFVCDRNADGSWRDVSVRSLMIPTSEDTNPVNHDDNPNNDFDETGRIDCDEFKAYLSEDDVYGQGDIRPMVFLDKSINTGGRYNGHCSFGGSAAAGRDDPQSIARASSPGATNPNNTAWGYSSNDADRWPRGASWETGGTALEEFGHSIGLVPKDAPGHNPQGSEEPEHHTQDFPDFMNRGYFHPTDDEGVRNNCRGTPTWERMTNKTLFVDCGRDTYWAPFARTTNWLCNHYNVAWDSLYLQPRAVRTSGCELT